MKLLESFKLYLTTDKNASKNTIEGYIRDVSKFLSFVKKDVNAVETSDIRNYIALLLEEGKSRSTARRATYAIRVFFKYLQEIEKIINTSPADEIKTVGKINYLPRALGKEDVFKLIDAASSLGLRSRLLLELLYGLGARVSEVTSLKVEDIDFDNCFIKLIGKGEKERHNPIHEGCIDLIRDYMKAYNISSGYLFPHRDDPSRHITREAVNQMVKKASKMVGIDPDTVSPHVLRHSFATHMLENGCDMSLVQEYLGHEDITTTKIYAKITKENKSNTFNKFHPLATR